MKAQLYYFNSKGTKTEIKNNLSTPFKKIAFKKLNPCTPKFLFVPVILNKTLKNIWNQECISIVDCFNNTSRAMISSRDKFMINVDKPNLEKNLQLLEKRKFDDLKNTKRIKKKFDKILENENILKKFDFNKMKNSIIPINYRPFDKRFAIFYTINRKCGKSIILEHLINPNEKEIFSDGVNEIYSTYGFNFVHSMQKPPFSHIILTDGLVDSGIFGYSTSKVAPMIINGKYNLSKTFIDFISNIHPKYSKHSKPPKHPKVKKEHLFAYIYGILNCTKYTEIFEPVLLHYYPRIYLPKTIRFFNEMAKYGQQLMDLHILTFLDDKTSEFSIFYENAIKRMSKLPENFKLKTWKFEPKTNTIFLKNSDNKQAAKTTIQFYCNSKIWNYKIGSIQILDHWLKGRKFKKIKRKWKKTEIKQFTNLLYVINKTMKIKEEINNFFLLSEFWKKLL